MLKHIIDAVKGKHPLTVRRAGTWPHIRNMHLELHPTCAVCGGTDTLDVHHVRPFHLHPELELNFANLVTLCESKRGGLNCHLAFGHLGNYKSFNTSVLVDAAAWFDKLKNRPLVES